MSEYHYEKKIYYHDTDAGGVVYYGSYLKHLEEARTEYFNHLGVDLIEYTKNGILFPVVHLELDYKKPARYGDVVQIFTRPEKVGSASLTFTQEIKRGEATLVTVRVVWACVNGDLKPIGIPEDIRSKIIV